jgi:hypothetical protein
MAINLDTKTGMYEYDSSADLEAVLGVKPVTGLTMGAFANKIIANAAAEQRRVEDALIDEQHADIDAKPETIGYQIVREAKYESSDMLNLPAYRYTVTLVVKWTDEYSRRPLAEHFYGYGPDWDAAEDMAKEARAAWIVRMNAIGSRKFQREGGR